MLLALDEAVARRGWEPLHGQSWLGLSQNGAQLGDPENWLAGLLHRAYVPTAPSGLPKDNPRDQISIYEVKLEPASGDQPLVAGVRAVLTPTSPRALWDRWSWTFPAPWRLATGPGRIAIAPEELTSILPVATPQTIVARVETLVTIDRLNIEDRLVRPVFGEI